MKGPSMEKATLTCPCGMTLEYEGKGEHFEVMAKAFSVAHANHQAGLLRQPFASGGVISSGVTMTSSWGAPTGTDAVTNAVRAGIRGYASDQARIARAQ